MANPEHTDILKQGGAVEQVEKKESRCNSGSLERRPHRSRH